MQIFITYLRVTKNEQDVIRVISGSKEVEYTLPKLYENKTRI